MPNSFATFEDFLWDYEVDILGSEGLATKEEVADLYKKWKKLGESNRADAAKTGAQTRAANAKKGISQKNIKGSTKQKRWASEIRGSMITGFSEEARNYVLENETSASFWIDNRHGSSRWISDQIENLIAAQEISNAAYQVELRKFPVGKEFIFTPELSALRDKSNAADMALDKFLSGMK